MAGAEFKGKQAEKSGVTVRVSATKTGKPPRRGVTVLRGERPVGRAVLFGEDLRIQSLPADVSKGLVTDLLRECGALPKPPAPKPATKPEPRAEAPRRPSRSEPSAG